MNKLGTELFVRVIITAAGVSIEGLLHTLLLPLCLTKEVSHCLTYSELSVTCDIINL